MKSFAINHKFYDKFCDLVKKFVINGKFCDNIIYEWCVAAHLIRCTCSFMALVKCTLVQARKRRRSRGSDWRLGTQIWGEFAMLPIHIFTNGCTHVYRLHCILTSNCVYTASVIVSDIRVTFYVYELGQNKPYCVWVCMNRYMSCRFSTLTRSMVCFTTS